MKGRVKERVPRCGEILPNGTKVRVAPQDSFDIDLGMGFTPLMSECCGYVFEIKECRDDQSEHAEYTGLDGHVYTHRYRLKKLPLVNYDQLKLCSENILDNYWFQNFMLRVVEDVSATSAFHSQLTSVLNTLERINFDREA